MATLISPGVSYTNANICGVNSITYTIAKPPRSLSPTLPAIVFETEDDQRSTVYMKLQPENNISSIDTMKILMLIFCYASVPDDFNALAYVKANNLERHFTFS